jgi:hypothetical protein
MPRKARKPTPVEAYTCDMIPPPRTWLLQSEEVDVLVPLPPEALEQWRANEEAARLDVENFSHELKRRSFKKRLLEKLYGGSMGGPDPLPD